PAMADGSYTFDRVGYLLADLTETRCLSVHLPADRPGSLRSLLNVFEQQGISPTPIHSLRTPVGEVQFWIWFQDGAAVETLSAAASQIDGEVLGRVLGNP